MVAHHAHTSRSGNSCEYLRRRLMASPNPQFVSVSNDPILVLAGRCLTSFLNHALNVWLGLFLRSLSLSPPAILCLETFKRSRFSSCPESHHLPDLGRPHPAHYASHPQPCKQTQLTWLKISPEGHLVRMDDDRMHHILPEEPGTGDVCN